MTEKLYYKDAYIKEFVATVISASECDGQYDIILDKTAFFPEEGGQYCDTGIINGVKVLSVKEKDGVIHHYTEAALDEGEEVFCKLDFNERFEKMQAHSGEHILSGIINKLYGLDNVGFHLGADVVTMDVSKPLTRAELDRVEELANEVVYANIEITAEFPSEDELKNMEYRSKLDLTENVRIVKIGKFDSCACCAPHVRYTGEIGAIKILDFAKIRGGTRIFIAVGRRAMRAFSELYRNAQAVSEALSLPKNEIVGGVLKLQSDLAELKNEYSAYRKEIVLKKAEAMPAVDGNALVVINAGMDEMIAFANIATEKVSGMLVILSGKDGEYKYVISSSSIDLRGESKEINKSLLGRGGGKPNMIQGSFASSLEEIEGYFNPSYKA